MKQSCLLALALALVATGALAQERPINDVGTNPKVEPIVWAPEVPGGVPPGCETCPPTGIVSASFTGATTQLGRTFRDGVASACPFKPYPGIFNPGTTYNYETFVYTNFGPNPACVTVNWDPNSGAVPCGANAHGVLYQDAYDPANQGLNFLGDVGSSSTQPFSAEVAADADFVLVAHTNFDTAICDFAFQIVNVPCQTDPTLCEGAPTVPPAGLALLALVLMAVSAFVYRRRLAN